MIDLNRTMTVSIAGFIFLLSVIITKSNTYDGDDDQRGVGDDYIFQNDKEINLLYQKRQRDRYQYANPLYHDLIISNPFSKLPAPTSNYHELDLKAKRQRTRQINIPVQFVMYSNANKQQQLRNEGIEKYVRKVNDYPMPNIGRAATQTILQIKENENITSDYPITTGIEKYIEETPAVNVPIETVVDNPSLSAEPDKRVEQFPGDKNKTRAYGGVSSKIKLSIQTPLIATEEAYLKYMFEDKYSCEAATTWTKNCYECICAADFRPHCTRIHKCVPPSREQPMTCKPYTVFTLDYNCKSCECNADGYPVCEFGFCPVQKHLPQAIPIDTVSTLEANLNSTSNCKPLQSIDQLDIPSCRPLSEWTANCYFCRCLHNARPWCKKIEKCTPKAAGLPASCRPGSHLQDTAYCTNCHCNDEQCSKCNSLLREPLQVSKVLHDIKKF